MKRNWLTYVSIVAALVAGMVCSTAFAEGKKGGNFSGGNLRLSNGSGSSQKMQLNGNNVIRSQNLGGTLGGNGGGLQSQGFPKVIKNPNLGSTFGQGGQGLSGIKVMPREHTPRINTIPGLGQAIGGGNGKPPQIQIDPKFGQSIGDAVRNKGKIDPGFGVGKSLGDAVLNKGKIKINPGSGAIKAINDAVLGKHCIPGCNPKPCDPCYKSCNKWCGPCWWWSPCWDPCYKSCYYPTTVYAYPQTIIVPVQTVVVGAPVAPVVAEQLMQIPVGATVTLQGNNLGDQLGMLVVQIDKISLPAQINEWKPEGVNVTLPMLGLAGPTKAQLWMVRADGSVAANVAVELLPAQQPQAGAVGQAAGQEAPQDAAAAALGAIQ